MHESRGPRRVPKMVLMWESGSWRWELPWAPAWHGVGLVPVSQLSARTNTVAWGGFQVGYQ